MGEWVRNCERPEGLIREGFVMGRERGGKGGNEGEWVGVFFLFIFNK